MLIHDYARAGNIVGVAGLLAKKIDINARDRDSKQTPLMQAAASRKAGLDMLRFLIDKGANVNATGGLYGPQSVLSIAIGGGNPEKVALLLDAGAQIGYERPERYDALIDAMHSRRIAVDPDLVPLVRLLIDRGAKLGTVSTYSESALSIASNNGRFDAIRVLLDAGSNPAPLQWTPLMRAVALGTLDDVRSEIASGADLAARDFWSRTPWLLSLQAGDVQKARLLLASGADRGDRGRCGKPPLMYPVHNGHTAMLRWLLAEGFQPDQTDDFRTTALMAAAEDGCVECACILLDAGADLHLANHTQERAVRSASTLEMVRLLVSRGADLNEISDEMRAALTGLTADGEPEISREDYLAGKDRRFGTRNPEKMDVPFWIAMVRCGGSAWHAKRRFNDERIDAGPVWCFHRFGKSINQLPDGRIIEIAGEHEDGYDPDFCIYNDVVVHHGNGRFEILGYPKDVFPPTDFHSATRVGEYLYIIGGLGYQGERRFGETPVYRLSIGTLAIEKVETRGDAPGWISRHKAACPDGKEIFVSGGKLCVWRDGAEEYEDNAGKHALDLADLVWRKVE